MKKCILLIAFLALFAFGGCGTAPDPKPAETGSHDAEESTGAASNKKYDIDALTGQIQAYLVEVHGITVFENPDSRPYYMVRR